ncbi:YfcE family phosphodiesterase [Bacillus mangrovi]|uniref:Phosphoesterase n=2 Tax=Metabacillus mangrovi TaxID=1491830 RepID=A0A7X2V6M7_9BACI|nr:YfcE family phosphodiesterase [Metabacillus mangrovi]
MKIAVLSDTHFPKRRKAFPPQLERDLAQADAIIHAGDFLTVEAFRELQKYGPLHAVYGNGDCTELKELLPGKLMLEFGRFRVGVVHGHEGRGASTEKRALNAFKNHKPDCVIFGHSHIPIKKEQDGLLIFNPGSPSDKRRQPLFSYGILTLGDKLTAEHVFFGPQ